MIGLQPLPNCNHMVVTLNPETPNGHLHRILIPPRMGDIELFLVFFATTWDMVKLGDKSSVQKALDGSRTRKGKGLVKTLPKNVFNAQAFTNTQNVFIIVGHTISPKPSLTFNPCQIQF